MADESLSGIYEIVNTVNRKRYIGSAKRLSERRYEHWIRLTNGNHRNLRLANSWKKHSGAAFEFHVLLICRASDLLFYEQLLLDSYRPEFNISPTAGSTLGRKHSEETKHKIATKALGRKRDRESVERGAAKLRGQKLPPERTQYLFGNNHAVGLKHSEEWKRQNSERHTGRPRPKSPEYRAKISAKLKGVSHSPERRVKQAQAQLGLKRKPYNLNPAKAEQRRLAGRRLAAIINEKRWGFKADG